MAQPSGWTGEVVISRSLFPLPAQVCDPSTFSLSRFRLDCTASSLWFSSSFRFHLYSFVVLPHLHTGCVAALVLSLTPLHATTITIMQVKALAVALLSLGIVAEASVLHGFPGFLAMRDRRQVRGGRNGNQIQNGNNDNNNNNVNNNGSQGQDAATNTCLSPDAVQTGSASDGQQDGAVAGQSPSETSTNNFINFCAGKLLTNGLQTTGGSCNGIGKKPMLCPFVFGSPRGALTEQLSSHGRHPVPGQNDLEHARLSGAQRSARREPGL